MSDQTECTIICTDCLNHQPDGARKRSQPTPLPTHSTSIERVEGGFFACSGCTQSFLGVFVIANYSVLCELTVSACAMCLSSDYLCMQPTAATLNEWGIRKKEGRFWTSETNICVMILISFLHFQFQFYGIAQLFSIIIIYLSKIKLVHTKNPPNPTQRLSFN